MINTFRDHFLQGKFQVLGIFFFMSSCIDPVEPEFQNQEGLVYVEAFLSSTAGTSYVKVSESNLAFEKLTFEPFTDAEVSFQNETTGLVVPLQFQTNTYIPPVDFNAVPGSLWTLSIRLADGRVYQSTPERLTQPVEIKDIRAIYTPELRYRETEQSYVAGHYITLDFNDPAEEENYYFWGYTSYELVELCHQCTNSILRNGACQENPRPQAQDYAVDYLCETPCWKKRFHENITIFSDEFANGLQVTGLPVSEVPLYTKQNIVVDVQQFSLTHKAHEYYKILKDIVDNNAGLNAPPPAALIGNITNSDDENEFVIGRFTAAASTQKSIFINRQNIVESEIDPPGLRNLETCTLLCSPQACNGIAPPCNTPVIKTAPCTHNRYRTQIEPEGWIFQ